MRTPKYISPTSLKKFYSDREDFYLTYLADTRADRMPQTKQMAVGSAFDAYIKAYLQVKLFGNPSEGFTVEELFEQQVEPQNRDEARKAGEHVFKMYLASGAVNDLMIELERAVEKPRFETSIQGNVAYEDCIGGIPFLGKPDVQFKTKDGMVVYDWKVNNFYSKSKTSPRKGYVSCDGRPHKDAVLKNYGGLTVNVAHGLNDIDKDWANQLSIYSWVLGAEVGGDYICGIDQLACQPDGTVRVARFRNRVAKDYQIDLYNKARHVWEVCESGYIFRDMTPSESEEHCKKLDRRISLWKDIPWMQDMTREQKMW